MRRDGAGNATKTKRLSKYEIKKQMVDSLIESEKLETDELNEKADKLKKCEELASVIKECEDITSTKKKSIICIGYHQGKVFKRFK